MADGHKYTLVSISLTKYALQGEMPAEMRLQFLTYLEKFTDQYLTTEIIAMVEPMDARGFELSTEARKLGPYKALDLYSDKWDVFAALNPSLQRAYNAAFSQYRSATRVVS
jgi:hypothetical protein